MENEFLNNIARNLIIKIGDISNLGLLNGKMGIIIFLYHYARFSNKILFEKIADEFIEDLLNEIHPEYNKNFEDGLAGISYGIDYLIQQNFIITDTKYTFIELDKYINEIDFNKLNDLSLNNGIIGYLQYVFGRYNTDESKRTNIRKKFLIILRNSLKIKLPNSQIKDQYLDHLNKILNKNKVNYNYDIIKKTINNYDLNLSFSLLSDSHLSLSKNGLAGIGLNLILQ